MVPDFTEVSEQAFFASHFHEQPRNPRPKNLDESFGFRGIHHSRWSWTNFFTISTGLGHFWGFCTDIPPVYMFKPILLCCKRASFVCRTVKPSFLLVIFFFNWGVILTSSFWSAKSQFCFVKSTRSGAAETASAADSSNAQFRWNVDFHAVFGDDLGILGANCQSLIIHWSLIIWL